MKKGDLIVCTTKKWEIVRGTPWLIPNNNEVYTVRDTHPASEYVTLMEGTVSDGYDKAGFKTLVNGSKFDKIMKAIMMVKKSKKVTVK